ncbi:MAG TPA: class II glutamine amidotransferase, partial [Methanomicrobiales archaeon]|nr:class II glutamine amidotransferase [Methanomicrobiales archaeon]
MCGIVGIVDAGGVSHPLYYALFALQHRGQESAGISTWDGTSFYKHKDMGLVAEVFTEQILAELPGYAGVGHVRYPTTGANLPENSQPFNFRFRDHYFAIAYNGNLVNSEELRNSFEADGEIFSTTTDTEIVAATIVHEFRKSGKIEEAVIHCLHV